MTTDEFDYALSLVMAHEAFRPGAYWDKTGQPIPVTVDGGNPTVGYGLNIGPSGGMTEGEARTLLWMRLVRIRSNIQKADRWFASLSGPRQAAVLDVAYNVGFVGWLEFVETRAALQSGDYTKAGACLLNSDAARELPGRYAQDAKILADGIFPPELRVYNP